MARNFGIRRSVRDFWHGDDTGPELRWPYFVIGAAVVAAIAVGMLCVTRYVLAVHTAGEAEEYLERCARIRKISRSRLLQRLVDAVCEHQLVLSILDDDFEAGAEVARREDQEPVSSATPREADALLFAAK